MKYLEDEVFSFLALFIHTTVRNRIIMSIPSYYSHVLYMCKYTGIKENLVFQYAQY